MGTNNDALHQPSDPSDTPEQSLLREVCGTINDAFSDLDDPGSVGTKFVEDIQKQSSLLDSGKPVIASVTLQAKDGDIPEIDRLAKAFGIELPDVGLKGLRDLFNGLSELGDSRRIDEQQANVWGHKTIDEMVILPIIHKPTIIRSPASGIEKLVIPQLDNDCVRLVFWGTGLTHPGNQPENPLIVDVVILPPYRLDQAMV